MELFPFVELRMDTPAQGFICEIAQHENGFDETPILLQQLGQLALPRIGLQPLILIPLRAKVFYELNVAETNDRKRSQG
jgi:hypothetical protein